MLTSEHFVRIDITDTGPGIEEKHLDLIFQPFERLDQGGTEVEGTGLGLTLAKQLVDAMGGTIGVTSAIDSGSTFWFELPRTQ